eukprot:8312574-Lingulodinium_polyedra.AAC.1
MRSVLKDLLSGSCAGQDVTRRRVSTCVVIWSEESNARLSVHTNPSSGQGNPIVIIGRLDDRDRLRR